MKRLFRPNRVQGFFVPLGNLSLCGRKYESDQNPKRPQPKLFPHGSLASSVTATVIVSELLWTVLKRCESHHKTGTEITTYSSSLTCFGLGILYPS